MPYLSLTLLGTFQITLDGKPATAFESDKVRALLAYLVVEAVQPHRREALAELFWPERPEGVARDNLRQALSNLRTAIGDRKATPPFLWITHEEVQFNPHSAHWLDVAALAGLLSACQNHPHRRVETCRPCLRRLRQAVALYGGDFLAQFFLRDSPAFEEWTLVKREWLQRQVLAALKHLATCHERRGEYEEACSFARRQVNLEPWDEEAQRGLMGLLALNGQRSAALAQYRTCCRLLADELGLEPAAETTALYEQIRMGEYPTGQSVASPWDRWANTLPGTGERMDEPPISLSPRLLRPPTPLHNLPPQPTPFIGREVELIEIEERLEDPACRLLTLVGAGGIGKTRLAWQVAFENIGGYNHGLYFVPLVGLSSPEYLISAIANAIQFTFSSKGEPKAQLLNYLRQAKREMLLVLDNFEHLLIEGPLQGAGVGLLVEILTVAPELKLLVTSRERLRLQEEWTYNVPGMRYPQDDRENGALEVYSAVQLFMACAQRAQADFALRSSDGPDLLRICRTVEGMPLGLELAAAWVRTLTITEIADEIEGSLDLLATSLQDVPERHRSLRAVFERSWKLLTAAEQAVFKRMSVFQGSFPRAAAEWVTGASLTILSSLVDKSLLKHTRVGQYEIHELLRQFCQEKLGEDAGEEAQARELHCRYYGNFLKKREADLKGGREKEALAEIEGEIDNVRAGWHWAVAQENEGAIENYLESLASFYEVRGWFQEGIEAFERAVRALRGTKPENGKGILLGKVLTWQGVLYMLLHLYERSGEVLEEGLAIARQLGSQEGMAYAYINLGNLAVFRGAPVEAKPLLQESLAIYRVIGDQYGIMTSLNQLGWATFKQGELDEAARYLQESLALYRQTGARWRRVWVHMDLADLALCRGAYQEAMQHYRESVAISKEFGYTNGLAFSLSGLGGIVRDVGAYQEAKQLYQETLTAYKTWGATSGMSWCLAMLGYIAILLGEPLEAETCLQESLAVCHEIGDEVGPWWYHCVQGELALVQGVYPQAKEHFEKSLALFEHIGGIGVLWGAAWSLNGLGKTACAMGAYQESRQYVQKALRSAMGVPSIPEALDILVGMATLLAVSGKREQAVELLALPLHHPATRKITKDRAVRLLAELEAELPPEVVATALQTGGSSEFKQTVAAVLGEKSPLQ